MMLIIGNNCGAAEIYKTLNISYNHPFMWSLLFPRDMFILIEQFNHINYGHIKPVLLTQDIANSNSYPLDGILSPNMISGLTIDNKCTVYYPHYIYSASHHEPLVDGINVYYNKNYEYAFFKYMCRIKRMICCNEPPKFFIIAYEQHGWTKQCVSDLIHLNTDYPILCITDNMHLDIRANVTILTDATLNSNGRLAPGEILAKHQDSIMQWVNSH